MADEAVESCLEVRVKRSKQSGFEVEQRRDGYFYIKKVPPGYKDIAVGDRVLSINGVSHYVFQDQTHANDLLDCFRLAVELPANDTEGCGDGNSGGEDHSSTVQQRDKSRGAAGERNESSSKADSSGNGESASRKQQHKHQQQYFDEDDDENDDSDEPSRRKSRNAAIGAAAVGAGALGVAAAASTNRNPRNKNRPTKTASREYEEDNCVEDDEDDEVGRSNGYNSVNRNYNDDYDDESSNDGDGEEGGYNYGDRNYGGNRNYDNDDDVDDEEEESDGEYYVDEEARAKAKANAAKRNKEPKIPKKETFERPYVARYQPNQKFMITATKAEEHNDHGFLLMEYKRKWSPEIYVSEVLPEGPFYRTALDKGDKIISINGKKHLSQWKTVQQAVKILEAKPKVTLFVMRPDPKDEGYKWVMENA